MDSTDNHVSHCRCCTPTAALSSTPENAEGVVVVHPPALRSGMYTGARLIDVGYIL